MDQPAARIPEKSPFIAVTLDCAYQRRSDGWRQFRVDAGRVFKVLLVRRRDADKFLARAKGGDIDATNALGTVLEFIRQFSPRDAALCATCDATLTTIPDACFAVLPGFEPGHGHAALVSGICPYCTIQNNLWLHKKFEETLREIMPGARAVDAVNIMSDGGRS